MIYSDYGGRLKPLMLATVTWRIALILTIFSLYFSQFRHVAYMVPFLALIHGLAEGRFSVPEVSRPFVVLICANILLIPLATNDGYKDLYFIISGVSLSLVLNKDRISPYWLFWIFVVGAVVNAYQNGQLAGGVFFDFLNSISSFEGNFAFIFGLLTVYAAVTRQWKLLFLSFLASVFTLKRVSLLAEVVCIVLALLPNHQIKRLLNPGLMVVFNLLFVAIILLYASHVFDNVIVQMTGQSANQFGLGRQELYDPIAKSLESNPIKFAILGQGPGTAYDLISLNNPILGHSNLHSDLLKILYEYGFIVFGLFILFGYSSRHASLRIMFLYANIIFISDNVLIYHFFLFFFCIFGLVLENSEKNKNVVA